MIETYIQGKWKLQYDFDGFAAIKTERASENIFLEYLSGRSMFSTKQGSVILDTTAYIWTTRQSGPLDYVHNVIQYYGPGTDHEIVRIKNETLVIAYPATSNPDYSLGFWTKE